MNVILPADASESGYELLDPRRGFYNPVVPQIIITEQFDRRFLNLGFGGQNICEGRGMVSVAINLPTELY